MSTTDKRVEELLDRWLASVDLHLRYLKLDDAAYARAESLAEAPATECAGRQSRPHPPAGPEAAPQRTPRRRRREICRVARVDVVPDEPARLGAHRTLHSAGNRQSAGFGRVCNGGAATNSRRDQGRPRSSTHHCRARRGESSACRARPTSPSPDHTSGRHGHGQPRCRHRLRSPLLVLDPPRRRRPHPRPRTP